MQITTTTSFSFNSDSACDNLWSFSFVSYHPYGVAGLVIDQKNNLLIAAGNYGKEPFPSVMGGMQIVYLFCFFNRCY